MSGAAGDAPLIAGVITGARYWLVGSGGSCDPALWSPRGTRWATAGEPTHAECPECGDGCPGPECRCGIHAFHPFSGRFQPELVAGRPAEGGSWLVWGEIEVWGEVEVHASGFRAELARPKALYLPYLLPDRVKDEIRAAAECHGIPMQRERKWWGPRRKPAPESGLSRETVRDLIDLGRFPQAVPDG